jgi:hypothetical protein
MRRRFAARVRRLACVALLAASGAAAQSVVGPAAWEAARAMPGLTGTWDG